MCIRDRCWLVVGLLLAGCWLVVGFLYRPPIIRGCRAGCSHYLVVGFLTFITLWTHLVRIFALFGCWLVFRYLHPCLLYTSDAADEEDSVDLGGRRIIK